EECIAFGPGTVIDSAPGADDRSVGAASTPLGAEVVPGEVGGDGEQPGAHVGVRRQRPIRAIGPQEGFLGEVVGFGGARGYPAEVPIYLRMMSFQDGFEGLLTH